jgi:peptidoglycan/LPS O-acetylase OafA/YrhL
VPPLPLPSLTSLRALAASGVFLAHAAFLWSATDIRDAMGRIGAAGAHGVSFFFLLSGAMLAYNAGRSLDLPRFYRKRIARIYPIYLLAFAIGTVVRILLDHGAGFVTPKLVASNLLMIECWLPGGNNSFPGTAWTLACEAFFYLLFPLLLAVLIRVRTRRTLALALLLAAIVLPGLVAVHFNDDHFFLSPLTRLPEFALGCLIGLELPRLTASPRLRANAGPLLLACAAGWVGLMLVDHRFPEWLRVTGPLDVVFAVTIVVAATADRAGRRWLQHRHLVSMGAWSYAFYSFHAMLLAITFAAIDRSTNVALATVIALTCYALVWVGSRLVFARFEEPLRVRIARPAKRPLRVATERAG